MSSLFDFGASHVNVGLQAWHAKDAASDANQWAAQAADLSWARQKELYQNRYRWTMRDMRRSGLNPILAATGGFQVGSGGPAPMAQSFKADMPTASSYLPSSSAKNWAEADKAESETKVNAEKAKETIEHTAKMRAEKGLITKQEQLAIQAYHVQDAVFAKTMKEAYLSVSKRELTEAETRQVLKATEQLGLAMEQLRKTASVYDGPAGAILSYLKEITNALGIRGNVGVTGVKALR